MSSRAMVAEKLLAKVRHAAEKLLAGVRQSLPARTNDKRTSEHKAAEGTVARDAFDKRLEQLQSSLLIKLPAEMVLQLDAEAVLVKDREKTKELDFRLQGERVVAEGAREKAHTNSTELHYESEIDVRHNGEYSERAKLRYTEMLLAGILTS
jgi:phosphoenolpyruvate-protein kinase (PTS system EI component)